MLKNWHSAHVRAQSSLLRNKPGGARASQTKVLWMELVGLLVRAISRGQRLGRAFE